jgi:mitochondrial import inner membrane translocase subunit TIM22
VCNRSYAKGFGAMGALFAGSECAVEKMRAKHDIYNSVYAGCFTGAVLAHKAGPQAMCAGCATFAALSAAIDHFLAHD